MRRDDLLTPPADLRVPEDNGAARHLLGLNPPPLVLTATAGRRIRLDLISSPTPPRGGENSALVPGVWGSARCAFRDHHAELAGAGGRGLQPEHPGHGVPAGDGGASAPPLFRAERGRARTHPRAPRLPTFEVEGQRGKETGGTTPDGRGQKKRAS
ncbi:hypothetical protein [Deinococcus hopiensis]|uniref:hypothetical protein n=1 Tax=Deinococcus hopiensis TaxID=309885 RepID=UPI00111C28C6|nr:hypothetical protein [Deinococcus hopiensis]